MDMGHSMVLHNYIFGPINTKYYIQQASIGWQVDM